MAVTATAPEYTESPFRSHDKAVRLAGCERMVTLLEVERAGLERLRKTLTKRGVPAAQKRHIGTRLTAVRNRLKSWERYAKQGYPRVPGAVEIPGYTPHRDA